MLNFRSREAAIGISILLVLVLLRLSAPGFFTRENAVDIFLDNLPVMLIALGMTLVVLTGRIDISVGSVFAVCSVVTGVCAKTNAHGLSWAAACLTGLCCGALNGLLVAYLRIPSIVATLAAMVALRDGLRWITQGSWIAELPVSFQWFGLAQKTYTFVVGCVLIVSILALMLGLQHLRIGRFVLATGSNEEAARLVGVPIRAVVFGTFVLTGALTGLAAALNAVRFDQVPSNSGIGLEMQVIAAVAIGGAVFTGGSGTIAGTVLGVVLLAIIGPALTFIGLSAYWETALQGAIILGAITLSALMSDKRRPSYREAVNPK
jgi:rhamnose transport system permease protein